MTQAARQSQRPRFATIEEEIEWHKENNSNILIPTTKLETNEFYRPVIDEVSLSVEQGDAYMRKDAQGKPKYALTSQGLHRLAICAGIEWDPRETRRIDNGTDKLYVVFQARGGLRKADGSSVWHSAVYELDLEIVREEIEEQHRNKCKNWNKSEKEKEEYVRSSTERDWREKRKRKLALADTGAKARVLRPLLGIKSLYSKEELAKPFIVIRYIFQPPFNDPEIRRQVTAISMGAANTLYGRPRLAHQQDKSDIIEIPRMQEPFEVPEEPKEPEEPEEPELPAAEPEPGPESKQDHGKTPGKSQGAFSSPDPSPDPSPDSSPDPSLRTPRARTGQGPTRTTGESEEVSKEEASKPDVLDEAQWEDATLAEKEVAIRQVAEYVGYDLAAFEGRAGTALKNLEGQKLAQLYKNLSGMIQQ